MAISKTIKEKTNMTEMKVGYSYLAEQFADPEAILNRIKQLLKKGDFTLGNAVEEFEKGFAQLHKVRFAIGVNSGTDALFLALKALGIGSGDEVISAPNSFIATTGAIVMSGAKPVFVDANDEYLLDPNLIEKAITPKTKAIMPVHLTGNAADMEKILAIAKKHNLRVVEDAAQAVSAAIDGKPVGGFGDAAGFSLHPLKNLNVWGDGGMITTNSEDLARSLRLLRNHGLKTRDEIQIFGINSRLDTLQAIVGNHILNELKPITEARIRNAAIYDKAFSKLSQFIKIPPRKPNVRQVYHTYVIQVQDRDKLHKYLLDNGVDTKIHYPIPIHLQEAAKHLGYKKGAFPVTEKQTDEILTLPVHQAVTQEKIAYVIECVEKFYKP
ncbi:DegT/DnrJ/EryC1/StrS family aminotransferase [Elusimicrobiota bacterium]